MEKLIRRLSEGGSADLLDGETIEAAIVAQWSGGFSGAMIGFAISVFFVADSTVAYVVGATVGVASGVAIAMWRRRRQLVRAEASTIAGQFAAWALMAVTSRGDLLVFRQTGGGSVSEL
ncbi:MAG TPA: hypothetical protein ENG98_02915, partial [Actinobacteria bacterium]|nr:hypothetical protein [Actinomycetota bacterium]